MTYSYNDDGFLVDVTRSGPGNTPGHLVWHQESADPSGRPVLEQFGNGLQTLTRFDPNSEKIIYREVRGTPPANVARQRIKYEYTNGLISQRTDLTHDLVERFEYDFAGRLNKWSTNQKVGTACEARTSRYGYDDIGNLIWRGTELAGGTVQHDVDNTYGTLPGQPPAGPHALTKATYQAGSSVTYTYDAVGNQTADGNRLIGFNHFDLPASVNASSGIASLVYDIDQARVKRTVGSNTVTTLDEFFENRVETTGFSQVLNVYALGMKVARIARDFGGIESVSYLHEDALGTPSTITGANAAVVSSHLYEPFGRQLSILDVRQLGSGNHSTSSGFAGHEPDDDWGLVNMRGRLYDPVTGRFVSADPLAGAPHNGQSYNRYSYVLNNPVNSVDPSGFDGMDLGISQIYGPMIGGELPGAIAAMMVVSLFSKGGPLEAGGVPTHGQVPSLAIARATGGSPDARFGALPNAIVQDIADFGDARARVMNSDLHYETYHAWNRSNISEPFVDLVAHHNPYALLDRGLNKFDSLFPGDPSVMQLSVSRWGKGGLKASLPPGVNYHAGDRSLRSADGKFRSKSGMRPPGSNLSDLLADYIEKQGTTVVGRELSVRGPLGIRRFDIVTMDAEGKLHAVEVKSGSAVKTRYQSFTDDWINRFGADGVGKLAGQRVESVKEFKFKKKKAK